MKKVFMSLAIVAAMFAASSCACNNNSQPVEDKCSCCTECEKDTTKACTAEECAACDSSATCCKKAE